MKKITTKQAPEAIGPYSQAVVSNDMIFVSGQLPLNPQNGTMAEGIVEQTTQVFANISAILEAAESNLQNVLKVTVYLQDLNDFAAMNDCYAKYFAEPYPARAAIQAAALPKGAKIEVDVIAKRV